MPADSQNLPASLVCAPQMCDDRRMSERTEVIPRWDLADRMRKALRYAGIAPWQMAAYLGVGRNTVSTWMNGRIRPSVQSQRLWALRCGVSYEWLSAGEAGGHIRGDKPPALAAA